MTASMLLPGDGACVRAAAKCDEYAALPHLVGPAQVKRISARLATRWYRQTGKETR